MYWAPRHAPFHYAEQMDLIWHNPQPLQRFFLLLFLGACLQVTAQSPCNLTNSSGCDCADGSNDCDLLPDMTVAQILLEDASSNPEVLGELGVSVSSPNIGHGPLRIVATDNYVCGSDTIYSPGGFSGTCSDGSDPRQLIQQRIYHKNADGSMSFYDRDAGTMTYHASHGHMHVDDWGKYSLRNEVPGLAPSDWPIVAEGAKLGFCLMDFGSCTYYNGHCVDATGNVLTTDAPNVGLGGGSYSCGLSNQGISAGYTDIYYYYLDGMQIPIPASVCNGTYKLVVTLDPYDYFLEEDETNNVVAVDITLTQQGGGSVSVLADGPTTFCDGGAVTLSLDASASSYSWSTGETTPTITVSADAAVTCTATTTCGTQTTPVLNVTVNDSPAPSVTNDTTCGAGSVTLLASASGTVRWYDAPSGGSALATGSSYTTPILAATTTYYAESESGAVGPTHYVGALTHSGSSDYNGSTVNSHLIFDADEDFTLVSVKVITDFPGTRMIELRNSGGSVLASKSVVIPAGESRVDLNFNVTAGTDLQLGSNSAVNSANFGGISPELKRSSSGTSFPYAVTDVVSITNTPYGTGYFYYFFDWEVKETDALCTSVRVPVDAIVDMSPACNACNPPTAPTASGVTANAATVSWIGNAGDLGYQVQGRKVGAGSFRQVQRTEELYNITGLQAATSYEWYVRAKCADGNITPFTPLQIFTTASAKLDANAPAFSLIPNPTAGSFRVDIASGEGLADLTVEDLLGRTRWAEQAVLDGGLSWQVDAVLSPGLYLVRVRTTTGERVERLVVE